MFFFNKLYSWVAAGTSAGPVAAYAYNYNVAATYHEIYAANWPYFAVRVVRNLLTGPLWPVLAPLATYRHWNRLDPANLGPLYGDYRLVAGDARWHVHPRISSVPELPYYESVGLAVRVPESRLRAIYNSKECSVSDIRTI